jgi:hypothetical protein
MIEFNNHYDEYFVESGDVINRLKSVTMVNKKTKKQELFKFRRMVFFYAELPYFPKFNNVDYSKITELVIINSGLNNISRKKIARLYNLRLFTLCGNRLRWIDHDLFQNKPKLVELNIVEREVSNNCPPSFLEPIRENAFESIHLGIGLNVTRGYGRTDIEVSIRSSAIEKYDSIEELMIAVGYKTFKEYLNSFPPFAEKEADQDTSKKEEDPRDNLVEDTSIKEEDPRDNLVEDTSKKQEEPRDNLVEETDAPPEKGSSESSFITLKTSGQSFVTVEHDSSLLSYHTINEPDDFEEPEEVNDPAANISKAEDNQSSESSFVVLESEDLERSNEETAISESESCESVEVIDFIRESEETVEETSDSQQEVSEEKEISSNIVKNDAEEPQEVQENAVETQEANNPPPVINSPSHNDYGQLLTSGDFSDFSIVAGSKIFKAHKCILATHSIGFAEKFKEDPALTGLTIHLRCEAVEEFLRYIYTGDMQAVIKNPVSVFVLASELKVPELKLNIQGIILDQMNESNAGQMFALGSKYESDELKKKSFEIIKTMIPGVKLPDDLINKEKDVEAIIEAKEKLDQLVKKFKN